MFRFENASYLWLLGLAPVLLLVFAAAWRARRKALEQFGGENVVKRLTPGLSRYKHWTKTALLVLGIALLAVAWANPQWGGKRQPVQRRGIDLFIALDISQSMLAEDVSPNRLERAKRFGQRLVEELAGNNLGVILFACNAFPVTPLTTDYAFANLTLATANPSQAGAQGTSLGEAIDLADRSFDAENENHKALIMLTDGEDHDGSATERASAAHGNGLLIYTVGVGSQDGTFIPVQIGSRSDYLRDQTGNPVRTFLDPRTLEAVAEAGGGAYFSLGNDAASLVEALRHRIDTIEKREYEERVFTDYESYFQVFIALALLVLLAEFFLSYRTSRLRPRRDWLDV